MTKENFMKLILKFESNFHIKLFFDKMLSQKFKNFKDYFFPITIGFQLRK